MNISLSENQHLAVSHREGALLVLAGPGAGKTRVLTERIRRILDEEQGHFRILALTFTNKAANEMIDRLADVPDIRERSFIGTLHSFCTEVLANRGKAIGLNGLPNIFESFQDRKQALADAINADPVLSEEVRSAGGPKERNALLLHWLKSISEAKANLQLPHMVEDAVIRRAYEVYDAELRASSAVDFDDLLLLTYRIFEETPKIAGFYRRQYRYICLDEGQDLNEAQYRILCALCGDEQKNIMVVGDPKQAIYVWNGADPKFLTLFRDDFGARTIELRDNYRCSSSVVRAAQALSPSYSVDGQLPIAGEVQCVAADSEESEAEFVTSSIKRLRQDGHPDIEGPIDYDRCAILGRNRFVFSDIESHLVKNKIPHHKKLTAGSDDPSSTLVQELELSLRLIANPHDRLHTGLLAKSWGIGESANSLLAEFPSKTRTGIEVISSMAVKATSGSASIVVKALQPMRDPDTSFRLPPILNAVEELVETADDEYRAEVLKDLSVWRDHWDHFLRGSSGGEHSLRLFLSHFALGTTEQAKRDGVALLTVHSAKGMEFDVVFLVGMCEGVFPDYRSKRPQQLTEEARNAFVAATRSKRLLFVSYPRSRMMPWGDIKPQSASRYFRSIQESTMAD